MDGIPTLNKQILSSTETENRDHMEHAKADNLNSPTVLAEMASLVSSSIEIMYFVIHAV